MSQIVKVCFWCVVFGLAACATSPPKPKAAIELVKGDYRALQKILLPMIEQEMKANKIMGLSIALVDDQNVVWSQGFGYADKKQKIKADSSTLYRAGSLSKPLNAIAIMQLVEKGKIKLDSPLAEYIQGFAINSRFGDTSGISPRNILSHHSGLPSDRIKGMWTRDAKHFSSILDDIRDDYVAAPPDFVYSYSNIGFSLLGKLIEDVSGRRYSQYMHEEIFRRLGLRWTHFAKELSKEGLQQYNVEGQKQVIPTISLGYDKYRLRNELPLRDVPAAGLNTSVDELSEFIKMIHAEGCGQHARVLAPDSINEMFTPQNRDVDLDLGRLFGLGWFINDYTFSKGELVVGHDGATVSHRALLQLMPHRKLGVSLLANTPSASGSLSRIAKKALHLLYQVKTGEKPPIKILPRTKKFSSLTSRSDIKGYFSSLVGRVKIFEKSGKLKLQALGKTFNLSKGEDGLYRLSYRLWGLFKINIGYIGKVGIAIQNINQKLVLVGTYPNRREFVLGEKIQPQKIIASWRQRVGRYEITEQLDVMDVLSGGIKIEDDFLVAYAKLADGKKMSFIINPINSTEAIVPGLGRGFGETVRVVREAGQEYLHFSGMRFRKL